MLGRIHRTQLPDSSTTGQWRMNDMVSLQKDVELISVLGPVEVLRRATIETQRDFNYTPYVAAAVLFLCVSIPLTRLTDHLIQRERRRMSGTSVR